ncbi:SpoIID/LytB domain-containing protein [candidate division KSB1 bacterium]|nr:SpoIID/LytB domain-containing protein [candidate division KSB1 bacterium]
MEDLEMKTGDLPAVRIGMIQEAEQITFKCTSDFKAKTLDGETLFVGEKDREYKATVANSAPAQIDYCVRMAIVAEKDEAEKLQRELQSKNIDSVLWHPGIVLELGDTTIDNREYWVVSKGYASKNEAEKFAQDYQHIGQTLVVKEIVEEAQGEIALEGNKITEALRIEPQQDEAFLFLKDVTVGIEFHWQHKRTQKLPGVLEIDINHQGKLAAINELDIETYLVSVNSSEMTFENPIELLKAQTIAARSTILATMGKHHYEEKFHLCSDDHCQCYHGVENISDASVEAARLTCGENLLYHDRVCDARYAKICGGVMEGFNYVWDDREIPYLVPGTDGKEELDYPLDNGEKVKEYIDSHPDVFCNTEKYKITSSLPYNTTELFRWKVSYDKKELENIIREKLRDDIGELIDLIPGERGASGRLVYLDIVGSKKNVRIGKELAIRRALSKSHLYSACFYITRDLNQTGKIETFHLHGAGWGHGVGLCQVGATVMAQLGYNYKEILSHYYKESSLKKLYS